MSGWIPSDKSLLIPSWAALLLCSPRLGGSMMYVALSYDHRIVDGREAVTFLVRIKEYIENPERIMMEI